MKTAFLLAFSLFFTLHASAQMESAGGASSEVLGTLIPPPPELDPELNYCLNVAYQVELREQLEAHPDDNEIIVRFALLQGLCELVFDGVINEATAMKLWARKSN